MTSPTEDDPRSELALSPERMLELADLVSRLVVERIHGLAEEPAWIGASRSELEPIVTRTMGNSTTRVPGIIPLLGVTLRSLEPR